MGRHREFDVDEALDGALDVFWRKGYEGTSLSDLTEAMGITRPSLYAAFGNKEELFRKALDRYDDTCMAFMREALARPTAREVVSHLLYGYADAQTDPDRPAGCLDTNGALVCSDEAEPIKQELVGRRAANEAVLGRRLEEARAAGDLPADCEPAELARYVMTIAHGMGVQASSGASREALHGIVAMTLRGWPSA
jgi:AcrR family transcriptional regulator